MSRMGGWARRREWSRYREDFVTVRVRPKVDPPRHPAWAPDLRSDTAIVLQGPLHRENDFTVETVRRYRTNFPHAPIVVSTWNDQRGPDTERLEALDAVVVTQDPPAFRGVQNANLQMLSATLGVQEAARLGATYVLKSRTDQRAYSERLLGLLRSAVDQYPIGRDGGSQRQRVIALSLNSFAYRMYGVSDMFTFGLVEDVRRYWDGTLDTRSIPEPIETFTHREFAEMRVCEVRYCTDFLSRTGWSLGWSLEDSWRAISERFLILDAATVDLIWPKYSVREDRWRTYDGNPQFQEIDFAMWLMMFSGWLHPDETILDMPW